MESKRFAYARQSQTKWTSEKKRKIKLLEVESRSSKLKKKFGHLEGDIIVGRNR
ncbi:hypothetical protein U8M14_08970 [Virgibacillus pantothenticus]|uniref:hypothetical protein n=1 Tax=Virgibacillus pantothenticus TaxID=1473 RepID=UPI001C2333B5|nr:hypothetical protein [Virgibacillus pantothenticus]MBU8642952.1 hypothetical protein [Virgibacillus pantothenticus]MBU8660750.1 hypothetical protein [Virgibacillus pantothenticus]MBU8704991.1 hypothetical protein [Virgibacillus pantothenticus]MBU8796533.1 hypothetical protein [Virgibacillus pantothenticus]MEB5456088.1 hypothetical protein [Virgibacillus pantothenticus]